MFSLNPEGAQQSGSNAEYEAEKRADDALALKRAGIAHWALGEGAAETLETKVRAACSAC